MEKDMILIEITPTTASSKNRPSLLCMYDTPDGNTKYLDKNYNVVLERDPSKVAKSRPVTINFDYEKGGTLTQTIYKKDKSEAAQKDIIMFFRGFHAMCHDKHGTEPYKGQFFQYTIPAEKKSAEVKRSLEIYKAGMAVENMNDEQLRTVCLYLGIPALGLDREDMFVTLLGMETGILVSQPQMLNQFMEVIKPDFDKLTTEVTSLLTAALNKEVITKKEDSYYFGATLLGISKTGAINALLSNSSNRTAVITAVHQKAGWSPTPVQTLVMTMVSDDLKNHIMNKAKDLGLKVKSDADINAVVSQINKFLKQKDGTQYDLSIAQDEMEKEAAAAAKRKEEEEAAAKLLAAGAGSQEPS